VVRGGQKWCGEFVLIIILSPLLISPLPKGKGGEIIGFPPPPFGRGEEKTEGILSVISSPSLWEGED